MDITGAMDFSTDSNAKINGAIQEFLNTDFSNVATGTDQGFMEFELDPTQDDSYAPEGTGLTHPPTPQAELQLHQQTETSLPTQENGFLQLQGDGSILLEQNAANLPQQTEPLFTPEYQSFLQQQGEEILASFSVEGAQQFMSSMNNMELERITQQAGLFLPTADGVNVPHDFVADRQAAPAAGSASEYQANPATSYPPINPVAPSMQPYYITDQPVAPAGNGAEDFTVAPTGQHPPLDSIAPTMEPYYGTEQEVAPATSFAPDFIGLPAPQFPPIVWQAPTMQQELQQTQSQPPYHGTGQQLAPTSALPAPDFSIAPASQSQPPQDPNAHLNPAEKQRLINAMKVQQPQLFTPDVVAAFATWKVQVQQAEARLLSYRLATLREQPPLTADQRLEVGFYG
jgi:hypothetical protein